MKKLGICIGMLLCWFITHCYADDDVLNRDGFGQVIQINTYFSGWVGKPMWLLEIRDLDHGQNIPYMFDITRGNNFWIPLTFGNNYLILGSVMQIATYQSCGNSFCSFRIRNFCNLESNGRINRGESIFVNISGFLSRNRNTYTCNVSKYKNAEFNVYQPCCGGKS